jgi:thiol-disulfide isomerase/thioredoxin
VQQKGKITKITLQKDGRTLTLEVDQKNDSLVTVRNGKSKKQDYTLMRKRYPDYQMSDSTPFPAPAFRRDSATIIGYYRNFDKISELLNGAPEEMKESYQVPFNVALNGFFMDGQTEYVADIDSLGRFSITVPVINSQSVYVDWKRLIRQMLLSPNDTLFLFADLADLLPKESDKSWDDFRSRDRQILCMGSNARINNELFQYRAPRLFVNKEEELGKGISDMEFLRICESVYNRRMEYLEKYITAHPAVSEKFRFLQATEEKYDFAFDLMQHRFDLKAKDGYVSFQEGYMDYVNNNFLSQYNPLTYMLFREYYSFICDYISYYSGNKTVAHNMEILLEEANLNTPENMQMAKEYEAMVNKIIAEKDTARQGQIVVANMELINKFDALNSSPAIAEAREYYVARKFMDMDCHKADSLLQEPVLKSLWMAQLYYQNFEQKRMPWKEKDIQVMKSRINNPSLFGMLIEINDRYAALNRQEVEYPESLKDVAFPANENDADVIFKSITEPYRGKVIFVDVWGTWCSPCIKNIKEKMPLLEEKFKSKDVVFMYLANSSPEPAWRNFIKQQQLTGEQIVHYRLPEQQQRLLERKLNVRSYPSYFIIDRAGNVSDYKLRYPMNVDETVAELEKALNNER